MEEDSLNESQASSNESSNGESLHSERSSRSSLNNEQNNEQSEEHESSSDDENNQFIPKTEGFNTLERNICTEGNLDKCIKSSRDVIQHRHTHREPELLHPIPSTPRDSKRSVVPVIYVTDSKKNDIEGNYDSGNSNTEIQNQAENKEISGENYARRRKSDRNEYNRYINTPRNHLNIDESSEIPKRRGSIYDSLKSTLNVITDNEANRLPVKNRRVSMVATSLYSPTNALHKLRKASLVVKSDSESSTIENSINLIVDPYGENLAENFRDKPWKPPSIELAKEDQMYNLFGRGKARFFHTTNLDLFVLGEGVGLYFVWLQYLICFTAFATVISIPTLLISYWGEGFESDDLDPMKMSLLTAGNHQYIDTTESITATMTHCTEEGITYIDSLFSLAKNVPCDSWFFRLWEGGSLLLTARHGSMLITIIDVIVCIGLIYMWRKFENYIVEYELQGSGNSVTAHSYTVFVTGLPDDTTDEEIIEHFNNLYRLDHPGWSYKGRCGIFGRKKADMPEDITDHFNRSCGHKLKAVDNTRQSRFDSLCKGTWLAECCVVHPEGGFILAAKSIQDVSKKMLEQRAVIKMYSPNTDYEKGPNLKKVAKAEKKLSELEKKLKRCAQRLDENAGASKLEQFSWKCNSAFIIFNHEESYRRCLRDYSSYTGSTRRRYEPEPLLFQGKFPLCVTKAPSPGNIIWENMEVSTAKRLRKMAMTGILTMILIMVTFFIIAWATRSKTLYQSNVVEVSVCSADIPMSFGLADQTGFDDVYVSYTADELMDQYGYSGCSVGGTYIGLSDSLKDTTETDACLQPCLYPSDSAYSTDNVCSYGQYSQKDIASCYCQQEMLKRIDELGIFRGAYNAISELGDICYEMNYKFIKGELLLVVASVVVVVVNILLKIMLTKVVPYELHRSVTAEALSLAQKTSLALFTNTLLVTLLVNAYIPSDNELYGNRDGAKDFDYQWYSTAGAAVGLTMTINIFSSHGDMLAIFLVLAPLKRKFTVFHSQLHMNKVFQGPQFNLATRLPFALAFMAVCMIVSPALPILYFLTFMGILIMLLLDKYMLLRFYNKPPQYDHTLAQWANSFMPLLLILHCIFAIYIYGNSTVFESGFVFTFLLKNDAEFTTFLESLRAHDILGFFERILRTNCFPFFVILVFSVIFSAFNLTFGELARIIKRSCMCCGSQDTLILQKKTFKPPYTCPYKRYIFSGNEIPDFLNEMLQSNQGWQLKKDSDGCSVLIRRHTRGERAGKIMLTWEVIKDSGIHTYHMEDNPDYAYIIYTKNQITQELGITTPKSPGGKLWNERGYEKFLLKQSSSKGTEILTPQPVNMTRQSPSFFKIERQRAGSDEGSESDSSENNSRNLSSRKYLTV